MTNGGRGVAFFAPFADTRWHFPMRPIEVSPIGVWSFFSRRGVDVLTNEVVWLWVPCLAALAATWAWRRVSDPRTPAARAPGR
jgi:inner membrane protein